MRLNYTNTTPVFDSSLENILLFSFEFILRAEFLKIFFLRQIWEVVGPRAVNNSVNSLLKSYSSMHC